MVQAAERQLGGQRDAVAKRQLAAAQMQYGLALLKEGDYGHMTNCLRAAVTTLTQLHEAPTNQGDTADPTLGWQLAEAFAALGDGLFQRSDLTGADRAFAKAIGLAESYLATQTPAAGQHRLATLQERRGEVNQDSGNFVQAAESFRLAYAHLEWLNSQQPQRKIWQRGMALLLDRLAGLSSDRGQHEAALETLLRAQVLRRRMLLADADDIDLQRELALSHERIGMQYMATGACADALAAFEQSLAVREPLLQQSTQQEFRRDMSVTRERLGDVHQKLGHVELALQHYQASLRLREELAQAQPNHAQTQADLIVIRHKLGEHFSTQQRWDGARLAYQAAHSQIVQLAVQEWTNPHRQSDLAVSHANLARVAAALADVSGALEHYGQAMTIRERLVRRDPKNVVWRRDLAITREQIGKVLLTANQTDMAMKAFQAAVDILAELPQEIHERQDIRRDRMVLSYQRLRAAVRSKDSAVMQQELATCTGLLETFSTADIQNDAILTRIATQLQRSRTPADDTVRAV